MVKNAYIKLEQSATSERNSAHSQQHRSGLNSGAGSARSGKEGRSEQGDDSMANVGPSKARGLVVGENGAADAIPGGQAPLTVKYNAAKSFFDSKQCKFTSDGDF